MKKWITLTILLITGVVGATLTRPNFPNIGDAVPSETAQYGYIEMHAVTVDDPTPLTNALKFWDNINDDANVDANFAPINPRWNIVELSFYGYGDGTGVGDPDGATFTFTVYATRDGGNAKTVYVGTGTFGTNQLSANPALPTSQFRSGLADPNYTWADTLAPSGVGDVWVSDITLSGEGGNNGVATCSFDMNGYWGLAVEITDMTAQGVTRIVCVASGY